MAKQKKSTGRKNQPVKKSTIHKRGLAAKKTSAKFRTRIVSNIEKLSGVQGGMQKKIKQPKRELEKTRKELGKVRRHIYYLNKKERETKGKGSKKKKELIRLERQQYILENQARMNELVGKRSAIREIVKLKTKILEDRRRLRAQLKHLNDLAKEAKAAGNTKEFERLIDAKDEIYDAIDATIDVMDELSKDADISGYVEYDEEDAPLPGEFVYFETVPIWEAVEVLERDINSGKYKWFIVAGMKISEGNSVMAIEKLKSLLDESRENKSKNYEVDILYNKIAAAAKYEPKN